MQAVAQYPNEYNALAIAYFSCDDKNGEADALHQRITRAWMGAGPFATGRAVRSLFMPTVRPRMNSPTIRFEEQFLDGSQALFQKLKQSVTWDVRMKARKTASFGVSYDYSQITYPESPMPAELQAVCQKLQAALGFLPNNCLLNYYEDGLSSMGFHSDSSEELAPGTGVAILSLGDTRSIIFRSKADRSVEFSYPLPSGSLLYMTKQIQDHWLHAIPKAQNAGERISLTFRSIVK
ncbi:2-oxoglutarate-Fe(II)-dependent oxygenase superfamily protein [Roseateles depolymerans]|uniref:2OG-Fe(II) oxygenase family oxidoreductase n=3 Tax=Roseateles depolymerans TaxID=76731 RepID=A0A0U3N882_9BURK|nr:2OG-Fe(II) oxygenase family oxidoreductase [Roseateles depolymerans]REG15221.1 2-oxoglutarate-Fe(II)-dependent oxygenase superfamily protein [Roseateles depolymerans]